LYQVGWFGGRLAGRRGGAVRAPRFGRDLWLLPPTLGLGPVSCHPPPMSERRPLQQRALVCAISEEARQGGSLEKVWVSLACKREGAKDRAKEDSHFHEF